MRGHRWLRGAVAPRVWGCGGSAASHSSVHSSPPPAPAGAARPAIIPSLPGVEHRAPRALPAPPAGQGGDTKLSYYYYIFVKTKRLRHRHRREITKPETRGREKIKTKNKSNFGQRRCTETFFFVLRKAVWQGSPAELIIHIKMALQAGSKGGEDIQTFLGERRSKLSSAAPH